MACISTIINSNERRYIMAEKSMITVGKTVKDFTLKAQGSEEISLSYYQGKNVLLSFHPLAWTPICAMQMKALEKNRKVFEKYNTVAFGLSVDSCPCKTAWAKSLRVKNTKLLADFWPHGGVAKSLGLLRAEGFSERANILLDEKGRIRWIKVYPIKQLPDIGEVINVLKSITL
jgi:peroxiredoxin